MSAGFMMQAVLRSSSEEETLLIGERLGGRLAGGDILALAGRLGAGKTVLAKGIARGLGIREEDVVSPTYTLIHEISGAVKLFHVDLYRVTDMDDLENAGFYDVFDQDAVTVIEWADRFPGAVSEPYLMIRLQCVDENIREIFIEPHGERFRRLLNLLVKEIPSHLIYRT